MAEMALVRLNHAKPGSSNSITGLSTAAEPLPESAIEQSSQPQSDPSLEEYGTYQVYGSYGYPEGEGYTKAFPKDK